jgi:hypothetical protein
MLSLIVHLLGGSLYGLLSRYVAKVIPQWASLQVPVRPKSDIIRLEKAHPTAAPVAAAKPLPKKPPAPPPPVEHIAPRPVPAPVEAPHELVHIVHDSPHLFAPAPGTGVAQAHPAPPAGPPAPKRKYYSDDQLSQMNGAFEKAISSSHQTLAQANAAMQTAPVPTTVHYQMHFNGIHEGMNPGDGIITVIKAQRIGNVEWYYTHYQYMYGDGHVEDDDIPWPFHFGPGEHDPFASHDRRVSIQSPPSDYKPTRELKPVLMQFFGGPKVD